MDFVAIDFETASLARSSACAIGLAFVENGRVVRSCSSFLRPPNGTTFAPEAIAIHGITPVDVRDAPTLSEIWQDLSIQIGKSMLVAHNAAFDRAVLFETLAACGCDVNYEFLCTCELSRDLLPDLADHQLGTVARHFGVTFNHHRAESDAVACAEIMLALCRLAGVTELQELASARASMSSHPRESTIGPAEHERTLVRLFRELPPKEQRDVLTHIEDLVGRCDQPARRHSTAVCQDGPRHAVPCPSDACPDITGLKICFTGELSSIDRETATEFIQSLGARSVSGVSKKTNILVVGGNLFDAYKRTGHQTGKLRQAIKVSESGGDLRIVDEEEFSRWLTWPKL